MNTLNFIKAVMESFSEMKKRLVSSNETTNASCAVLMAESEDGEALG